MVDFFYVNLTFLLLLVIGVQQGITSELIVFTIKILEWILSLESSILGFVLICILYAFMVIVIIGAFECIRQMIN